MKSEEIRKFIRRVLEESDINNFVKPEPEETKTYQLEDKTKDTQIGDPISDVKMNQLADKLGNNSFTPTVMTTAGGKNNKGQPAPVFKGKTEQA